MVILGNVIWDRSDNLLSSLLRLPWIILRIDIGNSPRAVGADLDDCFLSNENKVRSAGWKGEKATGGQWLGLRFVSSFAHP